MRIYHRWYVGLFAFALMLVQCFSGRVVSAQKEAKGGDEPLIGAWQIDLSKTKLNREGPGHPGTPRSSTFTWIFTHENEGFRMSVYSSYPSPAPVRSFFFRMDGKDYPCLQERSCYAEGGSGKGETIAYLKISPYLLARLAKTNGQMGEYVTYAISSDGKVLSIVSWSPETPEYHNVQVFNRQN